MADRHGAELMWFQLFALMLSKGLMMLDSILYISLVGFGVNILVIYIFYVARENKRSIGDSLCDEFSELRKENIVFEYNFPFSYVFIPLISGAMLGLIVYFALYIIENNFAIGKLVPLSLVLLVILFGYKLYISSIYDSFFGGCVLTDDYIYIKSLASALYSFKIITMRIHCGDLKSVQLPSTAPLSLCIVRIDLKNGDKISLFNINDYELVGLIKTKIDEGGSHA